MAREVNQREFAGLLYDSLYGLVLFFSLDSFLEIRDPAHFVFYLFSTVVVIHWWLMFKAADDAFERGVRDSAVHIVMNVTYILLLEFMILYSKDFSYAKASIFLLAVTLLDVLWSLMVLKVGHWGTKDRGRIAEMRQELRSILVSDAVLAAGLVCLLILSPFVSATAYVGAYVALYVLFMYLTFRFKIIDITFV